MEDALVRHVDSRALFHPNEPVIVALSGGIDSMVLFDVLRHLNNHLIIAHVNHNKREESTAEFEFLKQFAKRHKVPFEGLTLDQDHPGNFQHEARLRRYDFFRAVAAKHKARKIAVAHHLDDQVETVLMRIVRGTSFSGYTGIKEIRMDRNVSIVRPLMQVKKDDILAYAKRHKIHHFEDASNQEDLYTRNRFRHTILPMLREENPNLDQKIIQLAEYIDSADELIEVHKRQFLADFSFYNNVSLNDFNALNQIVKIKVIQHLVNNATDDTVEVSYEQYKQIIEMCLSDPPNQRYSLGDDYDLVKEYDVLYVARLEPIVPIDITVTEVGEYFVSDSRSFVFTHDKMIQNVSNYIELWYNDDVFPLFIRQRKNGDRMALSIGTKKVKDILIDQKIPRSVRDRLLVVADEESVLWIPGVKHGDIPRTGSNILYIYEVT